jgi:endogenous inhibitor of DNA gyrase (YacG/DUF329 family)
MENSTKITCPHCGKKDTWKPDNAFRPFCSERCKLIDLGAWADETHRIPGEEINPEPGEDSGEDKE